MANYQRVCCEVPVVAPPTCGVTYSRRFVERGVAAWSDSISRAWMRAIAISGPTSSRRPSANRNRCPSQHPAAAAQLDDDRARLRREPAAPRAADRDHGAARQRERRARAGRACATTSARRSRSRTTPRSRLRSSRKYVSPDTHQIVLTHQDFQGRHYYEYFGQPGTLREQPPRRAVVRDGRELHRRLGSGGVRSGVQGAAARGVRAARAAVLRHLQDLNPPAGPHVARAAGRTSQQVAATSARRGKIALLSAASRSCAPQRCRSAWRFCGRAAPGPDRDRLRRAARAERAAARASRGADLEQVDAALERDRGGAAERARRASGCEQLARAVRAVHRAWSRTSCTGCCSASCGRARSKACCSTRSRRRTASRRARAARVHAAPATSGSWRARRASAASRARARSGCSSSRRCADAGADRGGLRRGAAEAGRRRVRMEARRRARAGAPRRATRCACSRRALNDVTARGAGARGARARAAGAQRSCSTARRSRSRRTAGRSRSRPRCGASGASSTSRRCVRSCRCRRSSSTCCTRDGEDVIDRPAAERARVARPARAGGAARAATRDRATRARPRPSSSRARRAATKGVMAKSRSARLRGGPARRRLAQDQARAHARPGRARGRVGQRAAQGLPQQPAPGRARAATGEFVMLGKTFKGMTDETARVADARAPARARSARDAFTRLRAPRAGRGGRVRRRAEEPAVPGRHRAALRAHQGLSPRQARRRRPTRSTPCAPWPPARRSCRRRLIRDEAASHKQGPRRACEPCAPTPKWDRDARLIGDHEKESRPQSRAIRGHLIDTYIVLLSRRIQSGVRSSANPFKTAAGFYDARRAGVAKSDRCAVRCAVLDPGCLRR